MKKVFRYTFTFGVIVDEIETGGYVSAFSADQAIKRVRKFYKLQYPEIDVKKGQIEVWPVGFTDIIEVQLTSPPG
jgi:hypothetical protein